MDLKTDTELEDYVTTLSEEKYSYQQIIKRCSQTPPCGRLILSGEQYKTQNNLECFKMAVTPKCFGDPLVDRDRLIAHPDFRAIETKSFICEPHLTTTLLNRSTVFRNLHMDSITTSPFPYPICAYPLFRKFLSSFVTT
ncbi:hypothetical protein TNCV_781441 [Trichonephila clavipes]|nr:hypothetical protein TNCV_781441 [Trichonephila clavipes]